MRGITGLGALYNQVLCCASCGVPDFRGSYWGVVDNYLTRLPEYIITADYLGLPSEPYYTPLKYKPHPTLSAALPNLTDEDDVERYCFGAAWSMMADGSALSTGGGGEYVWVGCHYVPVGETDLTNAVGALCLCKVSSFTEGVATAEIGTPTVWLINDAAGDPLVFNDPDYMDVHNSDRKAFCGPAYFGWFDKRITSGTENRITYYVANQATPSVLEWPNTAHAISAGNYYNIVEVSRNSFPLALGCWSEEILFADMSRQKVDRYYQIGEFNTSNGRLSRPTTIDEDIWDLSNPPFVTLNNSTANGFETARGRLDEDAPNGGLAHMSDVFLDWAVLGSVWIDAGDPEDPGTTFFVHGDSSLVNRASGQDMDPDGLADWQAEFRSLASATTLVAVSGPVASGSADYATVDDVAVGYLRLTEVYGYHNQNGVDNPYSTSMIMRYRDPDDFFDYVGWRSGTVADGAIDAEVSRAATVDPMTAYLFTNFGGRYDYLATSNYSDAGDDEYISQWAVVRIPRKLGGGDTGEYHYYLVGSSVNDSGRTWAEVDDDSSGNEREPVEFYNVSPSSHVGPPTGFYEVWETIEGVPVRTVHRRPFAIQGQYDDHHPIYPFTD